MRALMKHVVFLAALLMLAIGTGRAAIDPATVQKLLAGDGAGGDSFGCRVSVSGDMAVIGACHDDDKGSNSGSAYVFVRAADGTWSQQAKLTADDGSTDDWFGESVALSGDTAVIGASWANPGGLVNAGAAYVFTRVGGSWSQQQKLTASDPAEYDYFGHSVSVSGDTVLIGVHGADPGSTAYVFTRVGGIWTEQQKLTASDAATDDYFGSTVSVSGDTVLIGAEGASPGGLVNAGAAYVFTRVGGIWTEQQKLTASDAATDDFFGSTVSVSGDTAVIGADWASPGGLEVAGAAYVFSRAGGIWTEQQKLTASDAAEWNEFGFSVSVSGDTVVIGAVYAAPGGLPNAGAAYVFTRAGGIWTEQQKLTASNAAAEDYFGGSVSVSGDTVLIGAEGASPGGLLQAGAAYMFGGPPPVTTPHINMAPIYKLLLKGSRSDDNPCQDCPYPGEM